MQDLEDDQRNEKTPLFITLLPTILIFIIVDTRHNVTIKQELSRWDNKGGREIRNFLSIRNWREGERMLLHAFFDNGFFKLDDVFGE